MQVNVKNIKLLKNLYDSYQINEYFMIPVNFPDEKLFLEQLKKFNIFRESDWFDIQTKFVVLQKLDFFNPHEKFVLNVQLNLSEIFNQNFIEVIDFDKVRNYVQFKEKRNDDYGNYYFFRFLKEGVEYQLYILKEESMNQILRDAMYFYKIPKQSESGLFIWGYDEETNTFSFWVDDPNIVSQVELLEEEERIVFYFSKGLYETVKEKFRENDIVLLLSQEQLTKILSYDSDIYLFFDNPYVKIYDDFSLPVKNYLEDESKTITNNVNKFYYVLFDVDTWEQMKYTQKQFSIKNNLVEKLMKENFFILSQNYPLYFVKGTQPNYYFENYFQSLFIREKQLYQLGQQFKNKNREIDLGRRLNESLSNNPDIKGILPSTFSMYFQDNTQKIDFTYRNKQKDQILNNTDQDFSIVFDQFIGEMDINDLVTQIKNPESKEQEDVYYKLIIQLIGINNGITQYDEKEILVQQLLKEEGIDYSNLTIEEIRKKQGTILNRYNNYLNLLREQFKNFNYSLYQVQINKNFIQTEEYQIKNYLKEIGFDINESNKNIYGLLLLNSYKNKFLHNVPVGLIQYSNRSILFFLPKETKTDKSYKFQLQIDEVKKYKRIYCSFFYYFYVDDQMIDEYMNTLKERYGINISRDLQEDELYKEFFEYFVFRKNKGEVDYINKKIILNDLYLSNNINLLEFMSIDLTKITLTSNELNITYENNRQIIDLTSQIETNILQGSVKITLNDDNYLFDDGQSNLYLRNDSEQVIQIPFIVKILQVNKFTEYSEIDVKIFMQELNLFDLGRLFTKSLRIKFDELKDIYLDYITGYVPISINIGSEITGYVNLISPQINEYGEVYLPTKITSYVHSQILMKCQEWIYKTLTKLRFNQMSDVIDTVFRIQEESIKEFNSEYNLYTTKILNPNYLYNDWLYVKQIEQLNDTGKEENKVNVKVKKEKEMNYNYSDLVFVDNDDGSLKQLDWCLRGILHQNKFIIRVDNLSSETLQDVQVKLDLTDPNLDFIMFNENYNNIMFMNIDEDKFLPHWCEKVDNQNNGIVWVKVDNIPQNGYVEFIMYVLETDYENNGNMREVFDYQVDYFYDVLDRLSGKFSLSDGGDKLNIYYNYRSSIDSPTTLSVVLNEEIPIDGDVIVEFLSKGINYNDGRTYTNGRGTHQTTNVILNPSTFPISINNSGGGQIDYYQTIFNYGQYYGSKNWYSQVGIEKNLQGNTSPNYPYKKYKSDSGYVLFKHYIKNSEGKVYLSQDSYGGKFIDDTDFNISSEIPQFDLPETPVNSIQLQIGEHYYGTMTLDWVRVRKPIEEYTVVTINDDSSDFDMVFYVEKYTNETGQDETDKVIEINIPFIQISSQSEIIVYDDKLNRLPFTINDLLNQISVEIGDIKNGESKKIICEMKFDN